MKDIKRLYNYQEWMTSLFLGKNGQPPQNLIVQAPTGAGKTLGALFPGISGFANRDIGLYPQQIIYGIPMRVLASSFEKTYRSYSSQFADWDDGWNASIQTGERPEDNLFEGKLIFATVDQILASFLNIPYGLSKRLDNINAGAFIGSYLVFDEFHLYPSSEMMLTVLGMLYLLKGISRFTLMTATFSRPMLDAFAGILEAAVVADNPGTPVDQGLFSDIVHLQDQRRTWRAESDPLSGQHIKEQLQEHESILCVCNQVDRAQQVYRELHELGVPEDTDVRLLHARFYREDRNEKEEWAQTWMGKDRKIDGRRKVIIATQVIEVGLDISAEVLLTECAPAASLIQRAGRCARRGGEGQVVIFPPPVDAKTGAMDFAPYTDDSLTEVCQRTWQALTSSDFHNHILRYHHEQALIDLAHAEHDRKHVVNGLEGKIEQRCDDIFKCMRTRDNGLASSLIRANNSVRLYIMKDRNDQRLVEHHDDLEAMSVTRGRIYREFENMQARDTSDADWLIAGGTEDEQPQDGDDRHTTTKYIWRELKAKDDVYRYWLFAAHPDAVAYDSEYGLRWTNDDQPAVESPTAARRGYTGYDFDPDTYVQHIGGLLDAYTRPAADRNYPQSLRSMYQYALTQAASHLDHSMDWETLDRYIRLMLALHDVGKLNQKWQQWAQTRHRTFVEWVPGGDRLAPADGTPLAHTVKGKTKFPTEDDHKAFEDVFFAACRIKRGTHAVESAEAAREVIRQVVNGDPLWYGIISAAICHHHTPTADKIKEPFRIVENGLPAVAAALVRCGFSEAEAEEWARQIQPDFKRASRALGKHIKQVEPQRSHYHESLVYYLFVRILRLADQRSSRYVHG